MTREQAISILDPLFVVFNALSDVREAIEVLDEAERPPFDHAIREGFQNLFDNVLHPIQDQHRNLGTEDDESDERFDYGSTLEWDDVRLPSGVTEADLDNLIFSLLLPRFQKTLKLVGRSSDRCKEMGLTISQEIVAARLQSMSDAGRIDSNGDLTIWNRSEVRLRDLGSRLLDAG